jgi:hypothetical protein
MTEAKTAGGVATLFKRRLLAVGVGLAEGVRQARISYREGMARPRAAKKEPADPPLDPEIAGYYANLELEPGAGLEAVKRAWKRLARDYHPDRFAADPVRQAAATRLVQDLHHAYRELVAYLGRPSPKPRK